MKRKALFGLLLLLPALTACTTSRAASLECIHLPAIFEEYFKQHYTIHTLSDEIKKRTVEQFLRNVDPQKTLLFEADVAKIRSDLPTVFKTAAQGNCGLLVETHKLLIHRSKENEELAKALLGPEYKLDENVEIVLDPKKRTYAKNADERKESMRKMIHFQMSTLLAAKTKMDDAKKQLHHRYELFTKSLEKRRPSELIGQFAESFALALDPHSAFLTPDDQEDFRISMNLSFEGIGATLTTSDGFTVVEELVPGGVAERSGQLMRKDKIIAVAQESKPPVSTIDMDLRDVVRMIRGKKGTKVKLTILRPGEESKPFDVILTRDRIDLKESAATMNYENRTVGHRTLKIGVIDLPSFYGGSGRDARLSSRDVKALLEKARKEKADGIVLNLATNGGGLLEEAIKISGFFIKTGNIVATRNTDAQVQFLADEDDEIVWPGPLAVLTTRFSASASEILAGAIRDYKRGLIVGTDRTFGKGTVQVLKELLLGLGGVKVTMGMFFLPAGETTQFQGVPADVQLPSPFNDTEIGESQLDYAIPPQKIASFLSPTAAGEGKSSWRPIDASLIKKLADASKKRVENSASFAELRKKVEEARQSEGVIKLAELRKKTEKEDAEEKKKEKEKRSRARRSRETYEPLVDETVNILADLIVEQR